MPHRYIPLPSGEGRVRAAFSRGWAFAPQARHLCFGKGAPNHFPGARAAEAATTLRAGLRCGVPHTAYPYAGCGSSPSWLRPLRGLPCSDQCSARATGWEPPCKSDRQGFAACSERPYRKWGLDFQAKQEAQPERRKCRFCRSKNLPVLGGLKGVVKNSSGAGELLFLPP